MGNLFSRRQQNWEDELNNNIDFYNKPFIQDELSQSFIVSLDTADKHINNAERSM